MEAAINVLEKLWSERKLPVKPEIIAERMGVDVLHAVDMGNVSGEYSRDETSCKIRINANEPDVRQRFTLAHELGHHCLRHGSAFRDTSESFRAYQYNHRETEANKFAAEILMPKSAVDQYVLDGMTDISDLSSVFEVSEAAMKYRLKNLGWI